MARPVAFPRVWLSGFAAGLVLIVGACVIAFAHEGPELGDASPLRRRLSEDAFIADAYRRAREHIKHHHGHDIRDTLLPVGLSNLGLNLAFVIGGLVYAYFYFTKVVKRVPPVPEQPDTTDDEFSVGLFDCFTDCHECLHATCCGTCRNAHTWHVTGLLPYWQAILAQIVIFNCCSCCCIPCCFYTYMRIELKHHMGLDSNPLWDCATVACCMPCTTGQHALVVDEKGGVDVHCCCNVTFTGQHAGNADAAPLMGVQGRRMF